MKLRAKLNLFGVTYRRYVLRLINETPRPSLQTACCTFIIHIYFAVMVKLTTDIVERKYSKILTSKSLSKTIKRDELWKLTHLHMNDMFISSIVSYIIL